MATEEDYKREILAKYDAGKRGDLNQILNPSSAKLRNWSINLLDTISIDDRKIYERFYGSHTLTHVEIKNFDNDKFKSVTRFIRRKSDLTDPIKLELLAILVDMQPRPLSKFLKTFHQRETGIESVALPEKELTLAEEETIIYEEATVVEKTVISEEMVSIPEEKIAMPLIDAPQIEVLALECSEQAVINSGEVNEKDEEYESEEIEPASESADEVILASVDTTVNDKENEDDIKGLTIAQKFFIVPGSNRNATINKLRLAAVAVVLLFGFAYILVSFLNKNDCMIWRKDHYESVPCDMEVNAVAGESIIPADEKLLLYQSKIKLCDTTTFFNREGKPKVFYGKSANKEYEYFSYPGNHPETGKRLKEITHYMIDKHISNTH